MLDRYSDDKCTNPIRAPPSIRMQRRLKWALDTYPKTADQSVISTRLPCAFPCIADRPSVHHEQLLMSQGWHPRATLHSCAEISEIRRQTTERVALSQPGLSWVDWICRCFALLMCAGSFSSCDHTSDSTIDVRPIYSWRVKSSLAIATRPSSAFARAVPESRLFATHSTHRRPGGITIEISS
jgi:hypothetical protein